MLRDILKKYKLDLSLIAAASVAAVVAGIVAHGALKPYTSKVATFSPLVFAAFIIALLIVTGFNKSGRLARVQRALVMLSLASLMVPASFLKAEMVIAPVERIRGAGVDEVASRIVTGDDFLRYRAWSRLLSMKKEEKDALAKELAPVLVDGDDVARRSATITLEVVLRKHSLNALAALSPNLKTYLTAHAAHHEADVRAERAATFARGFVKNNFSSVRKALDPRNRDKLPAGGLDALFLALATDEGTGRAFLRQLADRGDDTLKPLAKDALAIAGA